jgi:hypothetical protein
MERYVMNTRIVVVLLPALLVLTVTAGRAGAGLLACLALPYSIPTATPASSFGTMVMYP